jgi:DNA-binding Xre family transcriptional regulator
MSKPNKPTKQRETLDRQICRMIEESGLTTNGLAVAAGIPQPVLFRIVTGERRNIRLDTADKLCAYFGVRLTAPRRSKVKPARRSAAAQAEPAGGRRPKPRSRSKP